MNIPHNSRSATPNIGASGSLLIAMMFFEPFIPTRCCVAPEIPHNVNIWLHDLASLTNLFRVGDPASINDGSRCTRGRPEQPASSSTISWASGCPRPRHPTRLLRRRLIGVERSSICRPVTVADPGTWVNGLNATTSAAPAPVASASNDLGRNRANAGPSFLKAVNTF